MFVNWIVHSLSCWCKILCGSPTISKNMVSLHQYFVARGHIFSHVQPFYERDVSNLDRPLHRSLWV